MSMETFPGYDAWKTTPPDQPDPAWLEHIHDNALVHCHEELDAAYRACTDALAIYLEYDVADEHEALTPVVEALRKALDEAVVSVRRRTAEMEKHNRMIRRRDDNNGQVSRT